MPDRTPFSHALLAPGPAAAFGEKLALYAFLIGSWEYDAIYHFDPEHPRHTSGEIHASWVLEGRAIQDVWIVPGLHLPRAATPEPGDYYGTTLRVYDPVLDAWHILWSDPLTRTFRRQLGRACDSGIVQEGDDGDGTRSRWSFSEITGNAFRWTGEYSTDDGAHWTLLADFHAQRR
ncbi:MAG: hypothetical protein JSR63_01050 [Proteobacteria bacterium]|nr:hypothetical protein [Pseudomonadota bacterium]MBS0216747.1 hypothetical protein [Pseudomonadota bacterium]